MNTDTFSKTAEHDVIRTFCGCFSDIGQLQDTWGVPAKTGNQLSMNVAETAREYLLEVALPGYHKSDLCIEIQDDMLIIGATGCTGIPHHSETLKYARRDFGRDVFTHTYLLPEDAEVASAFFEAGILIIHLLKDKPKVWPSGETCQRAIIQIQ